MTSIDVSVRQFLNYKNESVTVIPVAHSKHSFHIHMEIKGLKIGDIDLIYGLKGKSNLSYEIFWGKTKLCQKTNRIIKNMSDLFQWVLLCIIAQILSQSHREIITHHNHLLTTYFSYFNTMHWIKRGISHNLSVGPLKKILLVQIQRWYYVYSA